MATRIEMERMKAELQDRRACTFLFGCGCGGKDLDEPLDPNEALDALTSSEKRECRKHFFFDDEFVISDDEGMCDDFGMYNSMLSPDEEMELKNISSC